jgi:hypothetical protein
VSEARGHHCTFTSILYTPAKNCAILRRFSEISKKETPIMGKDMESERGRTDAPAAVIDDEATGLLRSPGPCKRPLQVLAAGRA